MATKPLAPSTQAFSASYPTAFGLYDSDQTFCDDADNFVVYCRRKLGGATLSIELTARDIWTVYEEASLEYTTLVNMYRSKDISLDVLGVESGSVADLDGRIPHHSLRLAKHYTQPATIEAMRSGKILYSGSFISTSSIQTYNLETHFPVAAGKRIEVRDVWWENPYMFMRLYNTTTALNYMHKEFRFDSYTPETIFYLLPLHEDVLRVSMFRTQDMVRRSRYSWSVINNILTLYPAPTTQKNIWIRYTIEDWDPQSNEIRSYLYTSGSITHPSQIPFGLIKYGSFNQMARTYVRRIGLALAKEILGQIRSKMASIPLPDGDLTLNGPDLISQAQTELDTIRAELKEMFETYLPENLLAKERERQENIQGIYKLTPFKTPIVIG